MAQRAQQRARGDGVLRDRGDRLGLIYALLGVIGAELIASKKGLGQPPNLSAG